MHFFGRHYVVVTLLRQAQSSTWYHHGLLGNLHFWHAVRCIHIICNITSGKETDFKGALKWLELQGGRHPIVQRANNKRPS